MGGKVSMRRVHTLFAKFCILVRQLWSSVSGQESSIHNHVQKAKQNKILNNLFPDILICQTTTVFQTKTVFRLRENLLNSGRLEARQNFEILSLHIVKKRLWILIPVETGIGSVGLNPSLEHVLFSWGCPLPLYRCKEDTPWGLC